MGARLRTCAFIEKDKSFGIDIQQGALRVCRRALLHFGGSMVFSGTPQSTQHTHTNTQSQSSVSSSPGLPDSGPGAGDETKHSNPAVACEATALPKGLLHMSAPPRAHTVIGMERALWVDGVLCNSDRKKKKKNLQFQL